MTSQYLSDRFINQIFPRFVSSSNLTDRTSTEYLAVINNICDYCEKDFLELDRSDVADYRDYLIKRMNSPEKPLSRKTVRMRLNALMSVSKYVSEVLEKDNPFLGFPAIPASEEIPLSHIPTMEELDQLYEVIKKYPMLYLVFSLVLKCALTTGEVVNLREDQFVYEGGNRFIFIPASNRFKKDRYVFLPQDVAELYDEYISDPNRITDEKGHIFFNKHKKLLNDRNISMYLIQFLDEADIEKKFTVKDIRNRAILQMLSSGAPTDYVGDMVGVAALRLESYRRGLQAFDPRMPKEMLNFYVKPLDHSSN